MTDAAARPDLAELRRVLDAATPGPWYSGGAGKGRRGRLRVGDAVGLRVQTIAKTGPWPGAEADAALKAVSPTRENTVIEDNHDLRPEALRALCMCNRYVRLRRDGSFIRHNASSIWGRCDASWRMPRAGAPVITESDYRLRQSDRAAARRRGWVFDYD